jgi:cytochrome c
LLWRARSNQSRTLCGIGMCSCITSAAERGSSRVEIYREEFMTTRFRLQTLVFAAALLVAIAERALAQQGEGNRGAQVFRTCAACHSLESGKNMTGPSLAGIFGRKAGSIENFPRYSPALKTSNVVWDATTLDKYLQDPAAFIPHNRMTFPGIKDAKLRSEFVAYLEKVTAPGATPPAVAQQGGGMMGMGGGNVPNLKQSEPAGQVREIRYCRDTYRVTTADGEAHDYWERNLRLKTDSSEDGPEKGKPALVRAGMMGDRGDVIFADPQEISATIKQGC